MPTVRFKMRDLQGAPIASTWFRVEPGYADSVVVAGDLPQPVEFVTDGAGEATALLVASRYPYFITKQHTGAPDQVAYKLFVPPSTQVLEAQVLYVDLGTHMRFTNDASLYALIEAKVAAVNAANQALLSVSSLQNIDVLKQTILTSVAQATSAAEATTAALATINDVKVAADAATAAVASTVAVNDAQATQLVGLNNTLTALTDTVAVGDATNATAINGVKTTVNGLVASTGQTAQTVATQGQLLTAIDAWRTTGFTKLLGSTGWQKLPSGWIVQWGSGTTNDAGRADTAYPVAFPNGCFVVSVSPVSLDVGVPAMGWQQNAAFPKNSFVVWNATATAQGFTYLAIGY